MSDQYARQQQEQKMREKWSRPRELGQKTMGQVAAETLEKLNQTPKSSQVNDTFKVNQIRFDPQNPPLALIYPLQITGAWKEYIHQMPTELLNSYRYWLEMEIRTRSRTAKP